ncbi:hypothetical protein M9C64_29265, partial [Pseudomonas aeruginosa]|uniref:hypothetical protein n=1 Tax=Pseudomonas aeruginosa TaxID=287 RepID=UPI0024B206CB
DILLVALLLAVAFMAVVPLPSPLLDILIAVNITISVGLLMMWADIGPPVPFSVVPAGLVPSLIHNLRRRRTPGGVDRRRPL